MLIELGGKDRTIRFDYNALADLEQATGSSIQKLFSDTENIGFNFIRSLVWAGLKANDPGLTIQRTGLLITRAIEEGTSLESITKTFLTELSNSAIMRKKEDSGNNEKNV